MSKNNNYVKIEKMLSDLMLLADRMNTVDLLADQGGFNIFDDSEGGINKPLPPSGISATSQKWQEFEYAKNLFLAECERISNESSEYTDVFQKYIRILDKVCVTDNSYYGSWVTSKTIDKINLALRNLKREISYVGEIEGTDSSTSADQGNNDSIHEGRSSLTIGNNNKISKVVINQNSSSGRDTKTEDEAFKGSFVQNHPVLVGIGCSLIAAAIWAVVNGDQIIEFLKNILQ